jgi:hypothetical protein
MISESFDRSKLFLGSNKFKTAQYTNSTGSEQTLTMGRVMGRVMATNKVLPHTRTATDGSEQPRFVLGATYTVAIGATVYVSLCYAGDVAQGKVSWNSGDSQTSVLDEYMTSPSTDYDRAGTLEDLLIANSHICLIPSTELTDEEPV